MTRRGNVEKIILDFAKAVCEGERTMIDEKKVELMKKLQRLAERGVGGEKEGAQKKLQQLMKKYDMVFQRTGGGYRVFCNPPYGRAITDWVEKAYREGTKDNTIVVMLIPARTDTRYFHDFIQHRSEIRFVKGRLKFGNSKQAAPFPSMVVIFRGAGM